MNVLGVLRIARDPAKVEDQVRLLARTLNDLALEPDGTATACKAVTKWVRLPPAPLIAQLPGSDYIYFNVDYV